MAETALIISAVAPVPVDSGKRLVLRGLLDYFVDRLGSDNVHYALLGPRGSRRPEFPGVAHRLDKPSSASQITTLATRLLADRSYTVQEAMLGSPALRRQIQSLVAWLNPTIEVYDTLRLGQHAPAERRSRRRVLYLEDLFSVRYDRMLNFSETNDIEVDPLGEFAAFVPAPLRAIVSCDVIYRRVLQMERNRLYRREADMVRTFDASLLVNSNEVETLRSRSGSSAVQMINGLLPPIPIPVRAPAEPPELIFLGRLNIPHNDDAICAFLRTTMGALIERCPSVRLRIIGRGASEALRVLVADHAPNVILEGFIENLDPIFERATASLAPLRIGGGIKTKMLDALERGVPVLATSRAIDGIPSAANGTDGCIVEDDFTRWPDLLTSMAKPQRNVQLSRAALAFFTRTYGRDVVMAQYDSIFGLKPALGDRLISPVAV
jgi:glycosyltransferase involved in cell wall biosynthesis